LIGNGNDGLRFSNTLSRLIEFSPFDAIDELLDLGRISGGDVIVVFHLR
jgi:hypothetical protein